MTMRIKSESFAPGSALSAGYMKQVPLRAAFRDAETEAQSRGAPWVTLAVGGAGQSASSLCS